MGRKQPARVWDVSGSTYAASDGSGRAREHIVSQNRKVTERMQKLLLLGACGLFRRACTTVYYEQDVQSPCPIDPQSRNCSLDPAPARAFPELRRELSRAFTRRRHAVNVSRAKMASKQAGGRGRKFCIREHSKFSRRQPLDRGLHAIDATPARRRGGAGSSSLDGASPAPRSRRTRLTG